MINFGTTCILLEEYFDKEEGRLIKSTNTRVKSGPYDSYNLMKNDKNRSFKQKRLIMQTIKTQGDMPTQLCLYVTIYNQDIYDRKM